MGRECPRDPFRLFADWVGHPATAGYRGRGRRLLYYVIRSRKSRSRTAPPGTALLRSWMLVRAGWVDAVDETYAKIAGQWVYLYCGIDQFGQVIDGLVSEKRDLAATRRFFTRPLEHGPRPLR